MITSSVASDCKSNQNRNCYKIQKLFETLLKNLEFFERREFAVLIASTFFL